VGKREVRAQIRERLVARVATELVDYYYYAIRFKGTYDHLKVFITKTNYYT